MAPHRRWPDGTIVVVVDGQVVVINRDGTRRLLDLEGTALDVGL